MPLFVNVLSLKDLCESIFHKAIKEAKLTMQTKAGWEMRTTHFNVLVPHLPPQRSEAANSNCFWSPGHERSVSCHGCRLKPSK